MKHITKRFPGVIALDRVDFDLDKGEIHALVGENGAGKSTLMKILAGILKPDEGKILLEGKETLFSSVLDAQNKGIAMIYQELHLCENLTVAENIFLGLERRWNVSKKQLFAEAKKLLEQLGFDLDPSDKVENLGVSEKQLVSIAKALSRNVKILIMDEPTATITEHEVERLFEIMRDLKGQGISIVFISHRLEEIFEIADRVTVLRDGKKVGTGRIEDFDRNEIIKMMIGRTITEMYPKFNTPEEETVFQVKNFAVPNHVEPLSFTVKKGEIFGVAGLVGCGKSELALGLFGAIESRFEEMALFGEKITKLKTPLDALKNGIVMIPEDRKIMGLVLELSVMKNIILPNTELVSHFVKIDWKKAMEMSERLVEYLKIKTPSVKQLVKNLSGGNQQKVVIAKYLLKKPRLAIFVEPTRGIDVGSKVEIYKLINRLANEGVGIIFISSELPEIVNLCDRVMVLHRGKKTALLEKEEITQENIIRAAMGVYSE
ncbi:sugar ABC transporter ATP-binding protein [Thermotoga sp. KOL6]|uniref:sugar ABC transporter ATP-binding protein n=1 Tax=Thermotoga sp. KOL6 TaxID=126741 RepID=UPI000CC73917|nr:D-ribose transporter ATP-binding protein [Thermotoga sp. KOL6]